MKEDGRGLCCWDEYLDRFESIFNGDVVSDFYYKYKEDFELLNKFGINGIRIFILWSRVILDGVGEVNFKGIKFYNDFIDECLKNNVELFVILYYFDILLFLFKDGDWLNRKIIDYFINFVKVCFENFGDRVSKWVIFNELWFVV